ncbi:uncharacterized protein BCR38DRAFT_507955 [Pseudomassariella vexata]|uniref:Uncharacterized protein n=1 Tax=Pseudomassariella vexata TaxID=1141098 RepID=A0A1Y2EB21_9PEZI|nr:uncharacterized protein BCR38DRAFT_507955 [Pseudomassariella vexata]ORY68770.1 hypothetical protein BCR38DRAFT_507955 [Pseudomassariella vexata]
MSGVNSWLQRQRKTELTELAQHTGLTNYEGKRKPELELALDEYISENSTQFSSDPRLAPYFQSRARTVGSPVKQFKDEVAAPVPEGRLRIARRRTTRAIEDIVAPESDDETPESTSTAVARTPGRALSLAQRIPLPATPADVANAVDRSTVAVRNRVATLYKESGITEATHATRESLSTVTSVLFIVSAFELYFLRHEVLPDRYAFTIPAINFLGTKDYPVMIPDLFLLLTSSFWSPALLWSFTSSVLPSVVGYFLNLTIGTQPPGRKTRGTTPAYNVDPLTFSIVKALISFVVYGQKATFGGWIDDESIARVNGAVYGGYKGILVGTAISGLMSIYGAVLRN